MVEWENRGENVAAAIAAENQTLIPERRGWGEENSHGKDKAERNT